MAPTSATTLYVHDINDHIIAETDTSGATLREYIWLNKDILCGGDEAVNGVVNRFRVIANVLSKYLGGHAAFSELEVLLVDAARPESSDRGLFERLYHVVNHSEGDSDLRAEDPHYAAATMSKLRRIAGSLSSGSSVDVSHAIDAFWRG